MEQLQSHIWGRASWYMRKCEKISPYMRRPLVINDFAIAPLWVSLYMRNIWFSFLSVHHWRESNPMTVLQAWRRRTPSWSWPPRGGRSPPAASCSWSSSSTSPASTRSEFKFWPLEGSGNLYFYFYLYLCSGWAGSWDDSSCVHPPQGWAEAGWRWGDPF